MWNIFKNLKHIKNVKIYSPQLFIDPAVPKVLEEDLYSGIIPCV